MLLLLEQSKCQYCSINKHSVLLLIEQSIIRTIYMLLSLEQSTCYYYQNNPHFTIIRTIYMLLLLEQSTLLLLLESSTCYYYQNHLHVTINRTIYMLLLIEQYTCYYQFTCYYYQNNNYTCYYYQKYPFFSLALQTQIVQVIRALHVQFGHQFQTAVSCLPPPHAQALANLLSSSPVLQNGIEHQPHSQKMRSGMRLKYVNNYIEIYKFSILLGILVTLHPHTY